MEVSLKYGEGQLALSIPEKARVSVLNSSRLPALENLEEAFDRAMDAPLGGVRLEDLTPPRKVAIAVPDETRPAPVKALLPPLQRRLFGAFAGLRPGDITIIVAAGLHPPLDKDGLRRVVPEAVACRRRDRTIRTPHTWRRPRGVHQTVGASRTGTSNPRCDRGFRP